MIEFNREIALQSKEKLLTEVTSLNNIKTSLTNIINDDGYYGSDEASLNINKIINLNDDLGNFINSSIALYDNFINEGSSEVQKLDFETVLKSLFNSYTETNDGSVLTNFFQLVSNDNANIDEKVLLSLIVTGRTSEVKIINGTKCLVSVPSFEKYNGEKVNLIIYAPGATEARSDKLTAQGYMDGILGNSSDDTSLSAVIVVPLAFNVNENGTGGMSFEKDGGNLSDREYNYYAKFVNDAAHNTYTNSDGQQIIVDHTNVTLTGFSAGSRKNAEFIMRAISTNPKYNAFQENLGDVKFETVILASSGKHGIELLCKEIENGTIDQDKFEQFQGSVVYITADNDQHDLSNNKGKLYTNYNKRLLENGLIDIDLSNEYMKSLNPSELSNSTLKNYEGRTSLIAQMEGYTGHESTREAIVDVLRLKETKMYTMTASVSESELVETNDESTAQENSANPSLPFSSGDATHVEHRVDVAPPKENDTINNNSATKFSNSEKSSNKLLENTPLIDPPLKSPTDLHTETFNKFPNIDISLINKELSNTIKNTQNNIEEVKNRILQTLTKNASSTTFPPSSGKQPIPTNYFGDKGNIIYNYSEDKLREILSNVIKNFNITLSNNSFVKYGNDYYSWHNLIKRYLEINKLNGSINNVEFKNGAFICNYGNDNTKILTSIDSLEELQEVLKTLT